MVTYFLSEILISCCYINLLLRVNMYYKIFVLINKLPILVSYCATANIDVDEIAAKTTQK